ncbi:hypothetical protein AMS68_006634 [Peltaster fructicola]|uniref:DUF300-domain-containing protein n=1 Tax=Peltaster fructicola TaxID=286661 RepID=A0A6H0Y2A0_9PEZI|nr:hypothetical protein AMS68_006634 [Peltaster fructicola]
MTVCPADNTTLFVNETPLWDNGQTFHTLGLEIALGFGGLATIISLILVFFHGTHYSRPYEQKHIIRILMMIPVYAVISFLSFYFYKHAVYYQVIRDCYEAFAIASFFTLLCHYIAPDLHQQKNYFRTIHAKNWFWSVFGLQYLTGGQNKGPLRRPRSGLTWFNVVWIGVFQYCLVRVACTLAALFTQLTGRYCEHSINPAYGHFWVQVLTAVSVTIAMFCLIQFYIQTKDDLKEHSPFLKVICIKLVIFFSFWQQLVISFLASQYGPLKPSDKLNAPDIYIGIPTVLIDFEMFFFAIMHIFAFSWRPYSLRGQQKIAEPGSIWDVEPPKYQGGFLGIKAYFDAANPWDIIKASARGFRWLFVGYRHRTKDESYQNVNKVDDYMGPVHTTSQDTGTELVAAEYPKGAPNYSVFEDDRRGLLQDPSGFGREPTRVPSPYQTYDASPDPAEFDLSNPSAFRPGTGKETDYEPGVTAYQGHPALRANAPPEQHVHDPNWNMFGGAQQREQTYGHEDQDYPRRI